MMTMIYTVLRYYSYYHDNKNIYYVVVIQYFRTIMIFLFFVIQSFIYLSLSMKYQTIRTSAYFSKVNANPIEGGSTPSVCLICRPAG